MMNNLGYYIYRGLSIGIDEMNRLRCWLLTCPKLKNKGGLVLGRLAAFDDLGGKKRYIALGNWLMQGTLRPLHDVLIRYLRGLPQDCTYHQEKVFD